MRYLVMAGVLALAGCSSPWVRCERHLTPINGAQTTSIGMAQPGRAVVRMRGTAGNPRHSAPQRSRAKTGATP